MKNWTRIIVIVISVAAVGAGAYWFANRASAQEENLKASGTIETTEVTLSPEIGGRVMEVLVAKGDTVKQGQAVVRLDDTLLQDQLKQVQANIQALQSQQRAAQAQKEAALANYDLLKAGAQDEQVQAAQEVVKTAQANVSGAQAQLAQLLAGAKAADIAAAEAAVAKALAGKTTLKEINKVTFVEVQ